MRHLLLVSLLILSSCALTPEGSQKIDDVLCALGLSKYCLEGAK